METLTEAEQIGLAVARLCAERRAATGESLPRALLSRVEALRLHELGLVTWDGAPVLHADRVACVPTNVPKGSA